MVKLYMYIRAHNYIVALLYKFSYVHALWSISTYKHKKYNILGPLLSPWPGKPETWPHMPGAEEDF